MDSQEWLVAELVVVIVTRIRVASEERKK
jgi:hypothetical protein